MEQAVTKRVTTPRAIITLYSGTATLQYLTAAMPALARLGHNRPELTAIRRITTVPLQTVVPGTPLNEIMGTARIPMAPTRVAIPLIHTDETIILIRFTTSLVLK